MQQHDHGGALAKGEPLPANAQTGGRKLNKTPVGRELNSRGAEEARAAGGAPAMQGAAVGALVVGALALAGLLLLRSRPAQ